MFDPSPHNTNTNDSINSSAAAKMDNIGVGSTRGGEEEDPDESFDILGNMPPTPGGGLVASSGGGGDDAEESFADMLGISESSPTTPAAVAAQQGGGGGNLRRSPRLAASDDPGTGHDTGMGTGGGANRSLGLVPGSGGVKGRRGAAGVGGATGGGGGGGMKTPYSNRRSGRRPGGQAFPERMFTPGTAASNTADGDDANASFM